MNESDLHLLIQAFNAAKEVSSVAGLVAAATIVLALVQLTKLSVVQNLLQHRDLAPWRPLIAFVVGGVGSLATMIAQGGAITLGSVVTSFIAGGLAGLTGVGAHQLFKQTPRPRKSEPTAPEEPEEPVLLTEPTPVVQRFKHKTTGLVLELHREHEATRHEPNVKLWNPDLKRFVYRSSASLDDDFRPA